MAILQSNSGTQSAGTTAFTVSVGAATAGTSRVVIAVFGNTIVATPSGFTSRSPQVNVAGHYLFDGAGGASSWNLTASPAGHLSWHAWEVANGTFDTSGGQNTSGGATTYTTATITPASGERELIASIGAVHDSSAPSFSAWTGSFTETFDTTSTTTGEFNGHGSATRNITADGVTGYSTGATLSVNPSAARSAIIAAYATSAPTPSVNAGADVTHTVGTQFSRTATETSLTSVTARNWEIVSGPTGAVSSIGTAAALSWPPDTTGSYVLRYSAVHSGGTATDDVTVTVTNPRPTLVAGRGSTQNLTAQTTTAVSLTAPTTIATGNYLIARVAVDNSGTNGAAPGCTVTDPRSNTWTVLGPALVDPGAAAAGSAAYIAYTKVTTAYQAPDALTFNWGGVSTTAKAVVVEEWTYIRDTSPVAVTEVAANAAASNAPSVTITATAADQLVYTCLATEGPTGDTAPSDSDTTNGSWVSLTRLSTTSGTAASNQTVAGQYKQVTAAGAQTWNATITARDWAALAVVFAPSPPPVTSATAPAQVAAGTGAALNATTSASSSSTVTPAAASAAGTAPATTLSQRATATAAQATGVVPAAGTAISNPAQLAHAVGTAGNATIGVSSNSTVTPVAAQAVGQALSAIAVGGAAVSAGTAGGSGAASSAGTASTVGAGAATGHGAGVFDPGVALSFALTADDAVRVTGAAPTPTISSVSRTNVTSGVASAQAAAFNAGVATSASGAVTVIALTAGATGRAQAQFTGSSRVTPAAAVATGRPPSVLYAGQLHAGWPVRAGTPVVAAGVRAGAPTVIRTRYAGQVQVEAGVHAGTPVPAPA